MSKSVIQVENLSKVYQIRHQAERHDTLRDTVAGLFRKKSKIKNQKSEIESFHALKDVSFEVKQGEVLGIIGRNGAGKSTLLKILSRITEPTSGRVEIRGRVASLLEVGTGFHPELTGRENIFLNGAILGMSRVEIRKKFDEIVDFAGIEKFLDTPVKRYSSGMYVRLAFSVAAHLEPEILIIDEVLAVGDYRFQEKCLGKMSEIAGGGRTVLFVSHNLGAVRAMCNSSLLLVDGSVGMAGRVTEVVDRYLAGEAIKTAVSSTANRFNRCWLDSGNERLKIEVCLEDVPVCVGMTIYNEENQALISITNMDGEWEASRGITTLSIPFPKNMLKKGTYRLEGAIWNVERLFEKQEAMMYFDQTEPAQFERAGNMARGLLLDRQKWEVEK